VRLFSSFISRHGCSVRACALLAGCGGRGGSVLPRVREMRARREGETGVSFSLAAVSSIDEKSPKKSLPQIQSSLSQTLALLLKNKCVSISSRERLARHRPRPARARTRP
jgi:hypothetical protein